MIKPIILSNVVVDSLTSSIFYDCMKKAHSKVITVELFLNQQCGEKSLDLTQIRFFIFSHIFCTTLKITIYNKRTRLIRDIMYTVCCGWILYLSGYNITNKTYDTGSE